MGIRQTSKAALGSDGVGFRRRWVQTALGSECVQLMTIAPHNTAAERLQLVDFPKSDGIKTASGAIGREFESLRAHHVSRCFSLFLIAAQYLAWLFPEAPELRYPDCGQCPPRRERAGELGACHLAARYRRVCGGGMPAVMRGRAASRFPVAATSLPALPRPYGGMPLYTAS